MPSHDLSTWLQALLDIRTRFDGTAARDKLRLLRARRQPTFASAEQLVEYHDVLLFLRAYADSAGLVAETDRRLRRFDHDIARHARAADDPTRRGLDDSGLVGTTVEHVYSFRMARALSALHPRRVEIDWRTYWRSDTANIPIALVPVMHWHEVDAIDNDDRFNEQSWLEDQRTRHTPTCLSALLRLLASSSLPEAVQEHLYDQAEIPVRWSLEHSAGSRTWKRIGTSSRFLQRDPLRGRSKDLRATLAAPAKRLRRVTGRRAARLVADVREVLASRVRELYPLAGASPDEVYLYEPGRGLQFVIFGSSPAIRLAHESNMGAMFVRNGVPIGYGLGALIFGQAEMAINIFPAYRNGESAYLIEEFFRLFVRHFGARTLVVSSYQVGDGNDEGLESGSFWFYYKLGFRSVKSAVRALADREAARIAAAPAHRSSRAMLMRLAKSDMFFHLDPRTDDRHDPLSLADLAYAVTSHVAHAYEGDRQRAVDASIRRLSRLLPLGAWGAWSDGEQRGLRRLSLLVDAMGGLERWPRADRAVLARALRAKGGACERDFVTLTQRLPRLEAGLRRLARRQARRRRRR